MGPARFYWRPKRRSKNTISLQRLAWYLLPLQFFTFNFGATHTIHHFLVSQPFYLRQLVAAKAHAAFKEYGVRFNDAETVLRGNRWN